MDNLGDFFSSIGEEKKKKKEKTKELIGDVSLDDLFSNLKEEKSKLQKKVAKKVKEKEELIKQAQVFESFLFNEAPKVKKDPQKEVKVLEKGLLNLKDTSYKSIDRLMKSISKKYSITPLELHNQFKEKHGSIPDDWIKHQKEEVDTSDWRDEYVPNDVESVDIITPEPLEASEGIGSKLVSKEETTIDKSLQILDQLVTEEEKINESETEIARLKREMDQLRKMVNESTRIASSQGGGGEVRLEFLDDVDRDSAKVDGQALVWDSSVDTLGKFIGSDYIAFSGYAHTAGISTISQGLIGTPDIDADIITANSAIFSGNVSVAGTLTYEDVTNIDSIGLITARSGINVGSGITLDPNGDISATGITSLSKLHVGVDTGFHQEDLVVTGNARVTGILTIGTGSIVLDPDAKQLRGIEEIVIGIANTILLHQDNKGEIEFTDFSGTQKSVGIGTTVSVNTSGIITASQFSGYNHLVAPYGPTTTINVQVAAKTSAHRYFGTGSGQGYVLDGIESPFLTLTPGRTYRFSGSVGGSHPFRFYLDVAKSTQYNTGVTVGSDYVELEVTDSTPTVLHYQCASHGYMGNSVQVNSSNSINLNSQDASYYLNYNNFTNTPTIPTNNNQLTNGAGYITSANGGNADQLDGQEGTYYLNYNNFTNKPTIPTNNNELTNGSGYITTSFTNTSQLTNDAGFITGVSTFSGSYNDLTNTPTIPTNNNELTNGAGYITGVSTFSGSYNDLTNTPTIPSNNNELINGAGFITNNVSGTLTATAFSGDGSGLTNVGMDTSNVSADTLIVVGVATFLGNVTIGGTLTYEDVTDIDSVGIITANQGINITGGGLQIVGITTINDNLKGDGAANILGINSITATSFHGDGSGLTNVGMDTSNVSADTLIVSGVSTVGVITGATSIQATTYYGDGSKLTGISAGAGGTDNVSSDTIQSGIITATEQFYPPSLTSVQRDGLTFNVGAFIFNETENKLQMYLGGQWKNLAFELDTYSVVGL